MIETEFKKLYVTGSRRLYDDEIVFKIEDDENAFYPYTNLCWLKEKELDKLIMELNRAKDFLRMKREKLEKIIKNTDFRKLYVEFEQKYNKYPVQMSDAEAFGHAYDDGLIDQDTYDAARVWSGKLWNYVGD